MTKATTLRKAAERQRNKFPLQFKAKRTDYERAKRGQNTKQAWKFSQSNVRARWGGGGDS